MKQLTTALLVCALCVDWTRFRGTVKAVNLRNATVTLELKGGDIVTVPVDYQVTIKTKDDVLRNINNLQLDDKVTMTFVPSDPKKDESFEEMNQGGTKPK